MTKLIEAVLKAMSEIDNVEKNLNVGTGGASYKGVADKDVRSQMRKVLMNNGLVVIPISVEPKVTISEWDQESTYNNKTETKHKTQVLTEVITKYKLMHTSGESMEIAGYGHGVDSQDKSAGKATTYALKYALLNTFLVPTGDIDDTDNTHSDDLPSKPKNAKTKTLTKAQVLKDEFDYLVPDELAEETKPVLDDLESKCTIHNVKMIQKISSKTNKPYFSHKNNQGEMCFGKGYLPKN